MKRLCTSPSSYKRGHPKKPDLVRLNAILIGFVAARLQSLPTPALRGKECGVLTEAAAMMTLGIETIGHSETARPVPAFGRGARGIENNPGDHFPEKQGLGATISGDLWGDVRAIVPQADDETAHRVADAISLRGVELVVALLARFGEVDEALAALEDYAGAYDSLADFAADVFAERYPHAADLSDDAGATMGAVMIVGGKVFALRLGADLHVFWRV